MKTVRSPVKGERKVLGELGNTPGKVVEKEPEGRRRRERSAGRRSKEEQAKKQLNLSYFQSLPSNSLIILDNEGTWRAVFWAQLAAALSPHHVQLLERSRLLQMEHVMHNMTRVSAKGIVQLEERTEDLPHWVLSAMKCLANWPKQLRAQNGKDSCLPSYPGFENDVFNVVKDYFLGLAEPLTTTALFHFFLDAWVKAEALGAARAASQEVLHHAPAPRPRPQVQRPDVTSQFYTMSEAEEEDFQQLSHQERVARVRATFSVVPPLATSSQKGSTNSSNLTSSSSNSTFFNSTSASLSPNMSSTAIMRNFLPPNTCFETVFTESAPVTRIVPQAQSEVRLILQLAGI